METRANYVAIGLFVVAVMTAALGSLWWLYRSSGPGTTAEVRIIFPEPVTGLSAGGSVLFNGIRVGEVAELNFAPGGGDDVIALTRINAQAPIKTDTVAKLGFTGLTGVAYISLTGGTQQAQSIFAATDDGDIPTMRAQTSAFTNVLDSAQTVIARLNTTLTEVNSFISDNRSRLDNVVQNVESLTGSLSQAAPQVPQLIDDLASAGREIAAAAPQVTETLQNANRIIGAVDPERVGSIISNVDTFTQTLPAIAGDAQTVVGNVNNLVTRLDDTAGVLGEAVNAVRDVAEAIDRDAVGAIVTNVRDATGAIATRAAAIGETLDNAAFISADVREVVAGVAARREAINSAIDNLGTLIDEARGAVSAAAPAIESFGTALGAISPEAVERITRNADNLIADLAGQAPLLNSFLTEASRAATDIASISAAVAERQDQINTVLADSAAISANLRTASERVPQLVDRVEAGANSFANALGAVDPEAVSAIVGDVQTLSGALAAQAPNIEQLIADATTATRNIAGLSSDISARLPAVDETIENIGAAARSARTFADSLPAFADTLRPGIENIANVLAAVDPAAVDELVSGASQFAQTLSDQSEPIAAAIAQARTVLSDAETVSGALAGRVAAIEATIDNAQSASQSAADALQRADTLVADVAPAIRQLGEAAAVVTPARVNDIVTQTQLVLAGLAQQAPNFTAIMTDVRASAEAVRTIATGLAERAPQINALVDDAGAAASSVRTAADRLPGLVDTVEPGVESVSAALQAIDPEAIAAIQNDVASFAQTLAAQRENITNILQDASDVADRAETIVTAIAARTPQIEAILDSAQGAAASAETFAQALPGFAETLRPGIDNVSAVLSAIDPDAIEGLVTNVSQFAATISGESARISAILADAEAATASARTTLAAVSTRTPQIEAAIDDAAAFASRLPQIGEQVGGVATRVGDIVAAVDPEAVRTLVDDVTTFTGTLREESETVRSILQQADAIATRADRVVAAVSERTPQIIAAIDGATAAVLSAERFAETLPGLAQTLEPGIENIANVLSAVDSEAVSGAIENLRLFTEALSAQAPRISTIVRNAEVISADAAAVAARVRAELDTISATLADTRIAVADARRFASGLPGLLDTVRPGVESASNALQALDPDAIAEILRNVEALSVTLRDSREDIQTVLRTAREASEQVEAVTSAVAARTEAISSAIESVTAFAGNLRALGPDVEAIVARARTAVDAIGDTASAINTEAINEVIANVRQAAAAIGSRAAEIGTAIDNAADAARGLSEGLGTIGGEDGVLRDVLDRARVIATNLEGASQKVGALVDRAGNLFDGPVQGLVASVTSAAADVGDVAAAFASRADQIAGGLSRFSQGGLDDLRALLTQGRSTLSSIEAAVSSFDRNPSRIIFGGPDGPRYTPQRR